MDSLKTEVELYPLDSKGDTKSKFENDVNKKRIKYFKIFEIRMKRLN